MTTVAILQSSYIPWRGFFDLMHRADRFVLFDTAQYTKNDWRNRNRIKTHTGSMWLTIPVTYKFGDPVQAVVPADVSWADKHWKSLVTYYSGAKYFKAYKEELQSTYETEMHTLSDINYQFIRLICKWLGITTEIYWSKDLDLAADDKTGRLVSICRQLGADRYISGPRAVGYIVPDMFHAAGIDLEYVVYNYPEYPQLWGEYDPQLSILDLILNTGPDAAKFIWSR